MAKHNIFMIFLTACMLSASGIKAQNDKWFDKNGRILSQYLDDETGLLADEYLPDAHEFTAIEEALAVPEKVIKLNLAEQGLTEIPPEVFMFPNLQVLDLRNNKIVEVTDKISSLSNLQYLTLSNNGLEKIPSEIGELKHLLMLDFEQNALTNLPDEIATLENLVNLAAGENKIERLPKKM